MSINLFKKAVIFRFVYISSIVFFGILLPFALGFDRLFKANYKRRVVWCLEALGPVFIKLGQSISLKPYIFSKETIEACSNLQDKVSAIKLDTKAILGANYEKFEVLEEKPIAAGSIAQVYVGRLKTGEKVAVKIIKRSAEQVIEKDIRLLFFASKMLEKIPKLRKLKLRSVVANIHEHLQKEMDLRVEEEHLYRIKFNSIGRSKTFKTPRVFREFTTRDVLVMEFISAIPASRLPEGLNNAKISRNIVECYMDQVYNDGFFHADFHPGNILIDPQTCRITLIDFGIASEISYSDRVVIAKMLNGFLMKNYDAVVEAHLEGGYIKNNVDLVAFKADLKRIGEKFIDLGTGKSFSISGILIELFKIMDKYDLHIKEELLMLYKTIFFVEAVVMKLSPEINIWLIIKPWMQNWKRRNSSPFRALLRILEKFLNGN